MAIGPIDGLRFPECATEDPPFGLSSVMDTFAARCRSRLAHSATRERATLFACGLLLRASARHCPSSCPAACSRQAWAHDHAAPPLTPAGLAVAVTWQKQQDGVRLALPQRGAQVSPAAAPVAVRSPRAERLAAQRPVPA